jgi:hypothetical protein
MSVRYSSATLINIVEDVAITDAGYVTAMVAEWTLQEVADAE